MRCDSARELLSEYTEGSIQAALRIPLETHLGECCDCRAEADGLRDVWRMLDAAPVMDAPADLRAVVWAKIDAQEQARSQRRAGFRPSWSALFTRKALGWGAALLAVVALASFTMPGRYSPASLFFGFSTPRKSSPELKAGAPRHITAPGVNQLSVGVQWTGEAADELTATVESGPATVRESKPDAITLDLQPGAANSDVVVRLQWSDNGHAESKSVTIHTP